MAMKRKGVFAAVNAELTAIGKQDSALGRTALVLGQRLDDPETPATAVAAMAKELRAALDSLGGDKSKVEDPLAEARRKREERLRKAGA
jgi:hypothetical protein